MIKYTPKFGFCEAIFFGPFLTIGTPFLCIQNLDENISHFRIAATGLVLELNHNFTIMKKLKLIGEPFRVFKNTAFVKGMFNSSVQIEYIYIYIYILYS